MIIALSNEVAVMKPIADVVGRNKKLIFIDTASNGQTGDKTWLENQTGAIKQEYSDFHRYSIEGKTVSDFEKDLSEYDIIHIGGGRTAYLLHHIIQTGFDTYLREVKASKTIIGSSAGAKVLGKNIGHIEALDDFGDLDIGDGSALGFLNFDIWAHFGKEKYREKYKLVLDVAYDISPKGVYISDECFIVSEDGKVEFYSV